MTATMRTAVCREPGRIALETAPVPEPGPPQVRVRVSLCGICASDLVVWSGTDPGRYPYSPGHEFCGVIERVGSAVAGPAPGTRVVINPNLGCGECAACRQGRPNLCPALKSRPVKSNGGLSEFVALEAAMAHKVPASLSDAAAAFVEPLSCAVHAARRADPAPGSEVLVIGAGMLGLLCGLALRAGDAAPVFVETAERRRSRATELLQAEAFPPERIEDAGIPRFHTAIDCSGNAEAVLSALSRLAPGGRLVLAGVPDPAARPAFSLALVPTRELEIRGSWLNPGTFEDALRLAESCRDTLDSLETETFPLSRVNEAFERARTGEVYRVMVEMAP